MKVLEQLEFYGHEEVVFCRDKESGLRAIIAVHDTTLGPAIGGSRFWNYGSEEDALYDVLRLSRAMSYKNAAAGLPNGGGKTVIIGDPKVLKSDKLFEALGKYINRLGGCYYTAEDVNTNEHDMEAISKSTKFVGGLSGKSENPSPFTARGVWRGMKAAAQEVFGSDSLKGKKIAIIGLGNVGYEVARLSFEEGAELTVADINETVVQKAKDNFSAKVASVDTIFSTECDIFAPCALGAVISKDNASQLRCKIIAGAANNVLVDNAAGDMLKELNILYVPDYILNAGGVINAAGEINGNYNREDIISKVDNIFNTVQTIIELSKKENIPTYLAADKYAESIIRAGAKK